MKILHVTPHLGGGVGKAHSALRAVMPSEVSQTYCLLEAPRDRRYVDEISRHGGEIVIARNITHFASLVAEADVVQFEFWNHPKLYEALALADFPEMRSVLWSHISGLYRPVIPELLLAKPQRFVFTSPASLRLVEARRDQMRFSVIGSGFVFSGGEEVDQRILTDAPIAYLGTVDFVKMTPFFFDALDQLAVDATSLVWGAFDQQGEVLAKARQMAHPSRALFKGQTLEPRAALKQSNIFFYPLQPDHYGTAENALIEAMSLGLVPVVMANPAESAIVEHMHSGLIARSVEECAEHIGRLLNDHALRLKLSTNARAIALQNYRPEISAKAFSTLWSDMMSASKQKHEFASAIGSDPLSWYRSTIGSAPIDMSDREAKGTLAHFRSAFPDSACWKTLPSINPG